MNTKLPWLPNLTMLIFGLTFLIAAFQLPAIASAGVSTRTIPLLVCSLYVAFTLLQIFIEVRTYNSKSNVSLNASSGTEDLDTQDMNANYISLREFLFFSGPTILLIALYGFFFGWFSYVPATILIGIIAFRIFGNSWQTSLIHSAIGTVVLYFLFIRLLRIYNPSGTLLDLSRFWN